MNVTLKPDDERFVAEQIKSGRFQSLDDAVAEAIDRLRWDASPEEATTADIAAVREGLEQLDRGEGVAWEDARRELNAKYGLDE